MIDEDGFEFEEVLEADLKPGDFVHYRAGEGVWRGAISVLSLPRGYECGERGLADVEDGMVVEVFEELTVRRYPHACIDRDCREIL